MSVTTPKKKRADFVKELEQLIRKDSTCSDVVIDYGYTKGSSFYESDIDVNDVPDVRECVRIHYEGNETYRIIQSIEMDGYLWMMKDIIKGIERL